MKCSEYKEKLHSYISGGLSEVESRGVKRHLEFCTECREEAAQIKRDKLYLSIGKAVAAPPTDMKINIMSAIDLNKYKPKKKKKDLNQLANWGISLVASGLILMVLNTSFFGSGAHLKGSTAEGAAIEVIQRITGTIGQKVTLPMEAFNKGVTGISDTIINLNGTTGSLKK